MSQTSDFVSLAELRRSREPSPPLFAGRERKFRFRSKLERMLVKKAGEAVAAYALIAPGDRIMVCLSGGKDSYALLDALRLLQRRAPVAFELLAVNVDQGWPGFQPSKIAAFLEHEGVPHRMISKDFKTVVEANLAPDATPCSLCSRLRRGVLYNVAVELGCNKIALGHHMDDALETLMLNLFFSGKLASMPPRLCSDDGRNTVIRPLALAPEALLVAYAAERGFPLIGCACPSCGLPDQKRQVVKRWLAELEHGQPGLKNHMLAALRNVKPSHLLDPCLLALVGSIPGARPDLS
jgi:tRNA 2-thiocytidine biosynthesis protein TtcA